MTERLPRGAFHGGSVATPETTGTLPSGVVPSKKLTVPLGAPLPGGGTDTPAESVKGMPVAAGFWPDARLMDVVSSASSTETVLEP